MIPEIEYRWRGEIADDELVALTESHGGNSAPGWWDQIRSHSLGWVSARIADGAAVGFVNVAWDGCDHAFLLDTKVRTDHQRRGIGTELVRQAVLYAKDAGCEWIHVDFDDQRSSRRLLPERVRVSTYPSGCDPSAAPRGPVLTANASGRT